MHRARVSLKILRKRVTAISVSVTSKKVHRFRFLTFLSACLLLLEVLDPSSAFVRANASPSAAKKIAVQKKLVEQHGAIADATPVTDPSTAKAEDENTDEVVMQWAVPLQLATIEPPAPFVARFDSRPWQPLLGVESFILRPPART